MKRKLLTLCLCAVLFLIVIFSIYFSLFRFSDNIGKVVINDYVLLDDNKTIVFKAERSDKFVEFIQQLFEKKEVRASAHSRNGMIITESRRLENFSHESDKGLGEFWFLTVYQVKDKKLVSKTIDLFDLVSQYNSNSYLTFVDTNIILYQNSHYVRLDLGGQSIENTYLNLDQNKIESFSLDLTSYNMADNSYPFAFVDRVGILDRYPEIRYQDAGLWLSNPPKQSINLYSKNKKAFDILSQKGSYLAIIGDATLEDSVKSFELLVPKGTNIFENITIPAEYSIDGQEHKVNSYEEFAQYYKEDN